MNYVGSLNDIQNEIAAWSQKNFGDQDSVNPLLGVAEEVGELCHAVLKERQKIRVGTEAEALLAAKQDAVGDILIYLFDFCDREGLSLGRCLDYAWSEVRERDWKKNPTSGK